MAKDHFIPASLLARFSPETAGPARERTIWALRPGGLPHQVRAASVGYTNGLYDVDDEMFPTHGARAVDNVWSSYEPELPRVLDRLVAGSLTAVDWIDTLVPFVAASFARDRGYKERVVGRWDGHSPLGALVDDLDIRHAALDDTNIALNRVIEMERFAARALASDWTLCEVSDDLVLPDTGYGFLLVSENPDVVATLLPVGPRHLLSLVPRPSAPLLRRSGTGWHPIVTFAKVTESVADLNRELTKTAQDFVVGTQQSIESVSSSGLGVFDWVALDGILAAWPFNVDTRDLVGLHQIVRDIVLGNISDLDGVELDPYRRFSEIEPSGQVIALPRRIRADRFLSVDGSGLTLTVHGV